MRQGIKWWVVVSGALMIIGAFGPWATVLAISIGGTDGSNDGWLVVAAAGIGGGLAYAMRRSRGSGAWALVGGIAGLAVTAYDRSHIQNAISQGGAFAQALGNVGWGLNLALIASISMALSGLVALLQGPSEEGSIVTSPPATAPPAEPPPKSGPPTSPPE